MNEREAKHFGGWTIQFGKYTGTSIVDIPLEYLKELDEKSDFRRELNRYLRSDFV